MPQTSEQLLRLIWPTLGLVAGLLVLAAAVYYLRAWLRERAEDTGEELLLLAQYREMVRQGQLTEEEFRKIKGRMAAAMGVSPAGGATGSVRHVAPPAAGVEPSDSDNPN